MKRKMDLIRAMRTFLVVVELKSFSAASRQLNLVTSAVSRQVADLEKYYNCQLLYRTTRMMRLTSEGQHYLERFRDILSRLDLLENEVHDREQLIAGSLSITAPQNAGELGIYHAVSEFLLLYPKVSLSWLLVNRYVNLIEEGVDLAIRVGELPDSTFIARRYSEFKVLFVASPDYLSRQGEPTSPRELRHHRCIFDSSNRQPGRWRYMDGKKERHISPSSSLEVNQGDLVAQFSAAGHGIALLPDFLVQDYLERRELVSIMERYQLPPIPVSLVYPANRMKSPALKELMVHLLKNKPQTKQRNFSKEKEVADY